MKTIILISAKAGAGKDTFYDIIREFNDDVENISFATKLKTTASTERELVEFVLTANTYKSLFECELPYCNELVEHIDLYRKTKKQVEWDGVKDELGRKYLQLVGDAMKELYGQNYFADYAFDEILKSDKKLFIITDVRFPFEIDVIGKKSLDYGFKTVVVRVDRPNYDNGLGVNGLHNSEISLDDYDFENRIINDGTLEEYKQKVVNFVKEKL